MERQSIDSSSIRSLGYDPKKKILEIEFQSGEVYDYFEVPEEVHKEFIEADSRGRYFMSNIRGRYVSQKLT